MKNFKGEKFPRIKVIKKFNKKIKVIKKHIVNRQTVQEVLTNPKKNIPPKSGAYFFYNTEENKIVYIGISRNIKSRLQQHINHKSSLSASLAYLMAKDELKNKTVTEIKACFEKTNSEKNCRKKHQNKIKQFKVAFHEFDNNFELALFEIYASIKLESKWNSFKTH